MTSQPKRHHFLPERYQKGFSADASGKVWIHNRTAGETQLRAPVNNAVKRHFYSRVRGDGTKDAAVEKFLGEKIEGPAWPVLDALDNGKQPDGKDIVKLAIFVGYLLVRTPESRESAARTARERLDMIIRDADPDNDDDLDGVALRMRLMGLGEFDREQLRAEVRRAREPSWYSQNEAIGSLVKVANDVVDALRRLDVHVLSAPAEEPFITTDNPMLMLNASFPGDNYGVASPGVFKFVPLTKKTAVSYGSPGNTLTMTALDVRRARRMNVDLASRCRDLIIGSSEAQLRAVAEESKSAWENRIARFPAGRPA